MNFAVKYEYARKNWVALEKVALRLDKLDSAFLSNGLLGVALFKQGKFAEALAPLEKASEISFLEQGMFLDTDALLKEAKALLEVEASP